MKKVNRKIFILIVMVVIIIGIIVGINIKNIKIINSNYKASSNNSNNKNLIPEYIREGITLAGVTGTLQVLDTSDATATEMEITYGKTAYVDGKKITGLFVARDSLKVGDYVNYMPDVAEEYNLPSTVTGYTNNQGMPQEDLKWQILSINNDGTIDIISDKPTENGFHVYGSLGYNNGIYLLNDICKKQYSNNDLGIIARSINMEDIESKFNENGINARNLSEYIGIQYGSNVIYTPPDYLYYPIIFAQENGGGINTTVVKTDGIGRSESYYSSPTNARYTQASQVLTMTQHWYIMEKADTPNYFNDKSFYNLLFGENQDFTYWVASRYTICGEVNGSFGIRSIDTGNISTAQLYISTNTEQLDYKSIRPIISISQDIQIYGGDGSEEHPYQLKK